MIQTPTELRKIELLDTAYIPLFHTTVALLEKFVSKDVHWDTKKSCLTYQERTFCLLKRHHGQWTLEFQEPKTESVFPLRSNQKVLPKSVTIDVWHQ